MARKRYNEEDILRLLREIEVHLHGGMDVVSACRTAGISDKTYYGWRKRYGGMAVWGVRSYLSSRHWRKRTSGSKRFWQSLNWIS